MTNLEFITDFLLPNIILYIVLVFTSCAVFFPIIKRHVNSIIDPMFFCMVAVVFSDAVPFFLYSLGICKDRDLIFFIISEVVFWSAFSICSRKRYQFIPCEFKNEARILKKLFRFSLFVFIVTKVYTWTYIGIPLFMNSRLELYQDAAPGSGILTKFAAITSVFILLYSFHRLLEYKEKKYFLVFSFIIVDCLLSGSKGAIVTLFYGYFYYSYFYKGKAPKLEKKFIPLLVSFPIIVILAGVGSEYEEGLYGALLGLLFRFTAFGDVYWYAYPNGMIDTINYDTPLLHFFSGILGPLRIIPWENVEKPIGVKLYWALINVDDGTIGGPNARIPIAAWVYFKWGGLLFSLLAGIIMGKLIYGVRKFIPHSLLGIILYCLIYAAAINIPTDFSIFLDSLITMLLLALTYGVWYLLSNNLKILIIRKKSIRSENNKSICCNGDI